MEDCSKETSMSPSTSGAVGLGVGLGFFDGLGVFDAWAVGVAVALVSSVGDTDAGGRVASADEPALVPGNADGAVEAPGATDVHALRAATRMPAATIRIIGKTPLSSLCDVRGRIRERLPLGARRCDDRTAVHR